MFFGPCLRIGVLAVQRLANSQILFSCPLSGLTGAHKVRVVSQRSSQLGEGAGARRYPGNRSGVFKSGEDSLKVAMQHTALHTDANRGRQRYKKYLE